MRTVRLILLLFLVGMNFSLAQNRNSVWCFGDSAGINFGSGIAMPIASAGDGRGSCASIADESGNFLFYASVMHAYSSNTTYSTKVFDSNNNIMLNGDSIFGLNWYQELVIVPNPANDSTYYLFSIGVTGVFGLAYSMIDMRLNNGLGAVVAKNIFLQNFEQTDCVNAIKHGNGRDWWLLYRKSDFSTINSNNDWYKYLITPSGIQSISTQSIGQQNRTNNGHICFTPNGDKLVFNNLLNVIDFFDFDRCTGLLSNTVTIETDLGNGPYPMTWSTAFSPDASKLYVTTNNDTSYLYQYDLNASNITASKDTLWSVIDPTAAFGALACAPDDKIYLTVRYFNGFNNPYPYPDSVFNIYNMNLTVINSPDSLGFACDLQPHSFYLGGKRTYTGLPNNPDYDLGPLIGSPCDTLVGINEIATVIAAEVFVYYAPNWETAFINANNLKGTLYYMEVIDLQGKLIFRESGKISPPYFTKNLSCTGFAKGMYVVNLVTDKERLSKKFVVQ